MTGQDDRYLPIAEHGLIGDLQTAALVDTRGSISWFCCPRFDSPSVFASLMDAERGGHFSITVPGEDVVVKQLYLPDTAILVTRFLTPGGVGEIIDFMPISDPTVATDHHRIVRAVRVVRGEVTFEMECKPRFDYGRRDHGLRITDHHAMFTTPEQEITLQSTAKLERLGEHDVRATFTLAAGEEGGVALAAGAPGLSPGPLQVGQVRELGDQTAKYWRDWLHGCTYQGRWRETVRRSALTLKLLTYAPSGAPVAAPTTSLPEQLGGERNWDYRYTWIRDASFSLQALLQLGFSDEAERFARWLDDRVLEQAGEDSGPLKVMYRVDGSSDLDEFSLEHWEGYEGSAPVRVGNGAADQLQLDIYGEALDSIYQATLHGRPVTHDGWIKLCRIVDWLCEHWDAPDEGIWETRGGQKAFVYSRLMSWVALDRAIRISRHRGLPADITRWREARDDIYRQIIARGWDAERAAFVQHYDGGIVDAALLKMPLVGFLAPSDELWRQTLAAMREDLVSDSLVYRYDPAASPDGLRGSEGTFSLCTFWYVDALSRTGELDEARLTFEKMLTYANHLGLFSEEIGPTGEQLGNFPQAFTHLALISAAVNLDQALNERERTGR